MKPVKSRQRLNILTVHSHWNYLGYSFVKYSLGAKYPRKYFTKFISITS